MGIVEQAAKGCLVAAAGFIGCGGEPFAGTGAELGGAAGRGTHEGGRAGSSSGDSSSSGSQSDLSAGEGGEVSSVGGSGASTAGGSTVGGTAPALVECSREGWQVSAFASFTDAYGGPAALVLDGEEATRWSSGQAQAVGQWFELNGAQGIVALEVRSTKFPADVPTRLGLELDGAAAATVQSTTDVGVVRLTSMGLEEATTIRLLVVQPRGTWWSISEIAGWCRR